MKYKIRLEKTDEGYAVWCPGLPGCWSQGETEQDALENIKDAIQTYLETVEILLKDSQTRIVEGMQGIFLKTIARDGSESRSRAFLYLPGSSLAETRTGQHSAIIQSLGGIARRHSAFPAGHR